MFCFRQRPRVCLCTCVFTLAFASISVGGNVVRSSTRISAIFRPMSRFATVLARVDVCRARVCRANRAISSQVLVFTCALSLDSLQNFDRNNTTATKLHEELCCWHMYTTANCFTEKLRPYSSSLCTRLHLPTQFPLSDVQLPGSQS